MSNKIRDHHESDVVNFPVALAEGSIKITRIDGFLDSKMIYSNGSWKNICRNHNCHEEPSETGHGLCRDHHNEQLKNNIVGEKITKGLRTYKWSGKEWKLMCSVYLCTDTASSVKVGKCNKHVKEPEKVFASHTGAFDLYNQLKNDLDIRKQKEIKTSKKDLSDKLMELDKNI
jgi:hypothetical protein